MIRMSLVKGTDYQKAVQELIKERPSPGCHAAFNALRHISKAWDLRSIDREMAVFRSFCAEEEAAAAIFHALKRLRYPGAERLRHRDHVQRVAVMPFFWMINKAFTMVYEQGFQPAVTIREEEGRKRITLSIQIPGAPHRLYPMPPLHFSLSEGDVLYRFEREFDALKSIRNIQTMKEYVREGIAKRNGLLYAGGSGFPVVDTDIEPMIQSQLETVTTLLTVYLLIDMYPQHQLFVQQCLDVFIGLMTNIPQEPASTEGSATS
jgi:hypothetical protein